MKKILLVTALLAASLTAGAQTMYDAMSFSHNQYYGTARSMALGNAMTAIGGDLGSLGINPAGSAVASYSQFTITPGLTVSSVLSAYSPEGTSAYGPYSRENRTRMNVPNVGLSMSFETGQRYGLKTISFGFIANQTDNYNLYYGGFGTNNRTSLIAEYANGAYGYGENVLKKYDSFNNSDISWDILAAYQGGMIGSYGTDGEYIGVTETFIPGTNDHYVAGPLAQSTYGSKSGTKNDLLLNFGMNFSDRVYVGFNLGIPTARYRYQENFNEAAINPDQFLIRFDDGHDTYFRSGASNYQYMADLAGIYAKIGVILRPVDGLRLGASFQTPTTFTISETWMYSASTNFDDSYYNDSVSSPQGQYSYVLRSPYRASFGAAFTFAKKGLLSIDYELADYSVMRFRPLRESRMGDEQFAVENWANRYFAGLAHEVRVGAEVRVNPEWSLRAGYNFTTSPERWWTSYSNETVTVNDFYADPYAYINRVDNLVTPHYYNQNKHAYSFGVGYSSPGSFFMDAAVRLIRYPAETTSLYFDYESCDSSGDYRLVEAPTLVSYRNLWNVSLTFGWRF